MREAFVCIVVASRIGQKPAFFLGQALNFSSRSSRSLRRNDKLPARFNVFSSSGALPNLVLPTIDSSQPRTSEKKASSTTKPGIITRTRASKARGLRIVVPFATSSGKTARHLSAAAAVIAPSGLEVPLPRLISPEEGVGIIGDAANDEIIESGASFVVRVKEDGTYEKLHPFCGRSPEAHPALVLNADFRPLSYLPLSLWSWQQAVTACVLNRIQVIEEYDHIVRSPSLSMKLPSVVALKRFVQVQTRPAFTRYNVFLRDKFTCQYCLRRFRPNDLSFDHVTPRCRGGAHCWENVVTSCYDCNTRKGGRMPTDAFMIPRTKPYMPTNFELQDKGREFLPTRIHSSWINYL
mmetsp:Transcript_10533/g.17223  ORF Transcript_10533/g.17223 Transcript_10533/m.17223 type:complete len:351 (+) Transcript_10533:184-1236(+)|eukprot:CAMPEP_0184645906 /NCGR_PEP_ID=MMETSP0308-20130426/2508_1 /TAXON_ID=38269 /ORGANISM="Gloeochaete witrockiana, Strain SAG 46.84" /LENGTH=350 /DNA_ID=CAMNT_0027075403 /DNA_START=154 /DNA_END=1206 /DNA_ORIENTATION=-